MVLVFNLHAFPRSKFHRQAHQTVRSERMAKATRYSTDELGGKHDSEEENWAYSETKINFKYFLQGK